MLKQRILTASLLALLAIAALFIAPDWLWSGLILLIATIGAWEWGGFARITKTWQRVLYAVLPAGITLLALQGLTLPVSLGWLVMEMLLLMLVVTRYQKSSGKQGLDSPIFILLAGILGLALFAFAMIQFRAAAGPAALLLSLFTIWAMDTGAYFTGRRFGKHKLAPHVSPGKTWEGVWGGAVLAGLVALIGTFLISEPTPISLLPFVLLSAFIAMFSVFGDLFESVLKRQVDLKDSGQLLPGHGGILDRIDSLLIAMPMFYLLWSLGVLLQ
ncbi:phosphatidate cytidylyltransferase [Thiomicrorhabdus cannonii]|uniref:phosphatidate cytidylyltransferase n=1 Tax=Thiomicrorhabdus cannonii TaxID=2748011 RepID=UPI0015BC92D1|nr:phosphatidate cytidylyltransferase [Thiomicrorhabdus cannonii]